MTDEDDDGAVGFLDRDRMTQPIIVGNARGHGFSGGVGARPERN